MSVLSISNWNCNLIPMTTNTQQEKAMKPTQLTLEHLAGYLPYGLKVQWSDGRTSLVNPYLDEDYRQNNEIGLFIVLFAIEKELKLKLILRNLSDLTKEIEHNGERFVPIVELLKLKFPDRPKEGAYSKIEFETEGWPRAFYTFSAAHDIIIHTFDLKNEPFWIIQKLYEWKFDLHGLIDAGLAVDVNQVKGL